MSLRLSGVGRTPTPKQQLNKKTPINRLFHSGIFQYEIIYHKFSKMSTFVYIIFMYHSKKINHKKIKNYQSFKNHLGGRAMFSFGIAIYPEDLEKLKKLQDAFQSKSKSETIRQALNLAYLLVYENSKEKESKNEIN